MEPLFFILILLILIGLSIRVIIPKKDGTVFAGAGPRGTIYPKKQKLRYIRWVLLNLLIIVLLVTIGWLILQEKTAADSPTAAHIIALVLCSLLCDVFLNALLGCIYVLTRLITQKKERTNIMYGKLVLFASGTLFLGRYVFSILSGLLNGRFNAP